jgi:hypothetical protein
MKYLIVFSLFELLVLAACTESEGTVDPTILLPAPILEDIQTFSNSDVTYFRLWNNFENGKPSVAGENLLWEMHESGIQLKDVWFPATPTDCGSAAAVTVVVAKLSEPNARILNMGFVSYPEDWWSINCGIAKLWHYSFE